MKRPIPYPAENKLQQTITIEDLATAVGKTLFEFDEMLGALVTLGFPSPERESGEFEVVDILDWVGNQQALILAILTVATKTLTLRH